MKLVPNDAHNYPRSEWMCWDRARPFVVLGSRGNEPCPTCGTAAELLFGVTVANDDGALLVPVSEGA